MIGYTRDLLYNLGVAENIWSLSLRHDIQTWFVTLIPAGAFCLFWFWFFVLFWFFITGPYDFKRGGVRSDYWATTVLQGHDHNWFQH